MNNSNENKYTKKRIFLLDEIRGFALLCMIFYHGFFTMAMLFNIKLGEKLIHFFEPAEPFFAGAFILISGICSHLSKSNRKRGIKLLGVSLLISFVTIIFDFFTNTSVSIFFGILHMLSISILLYDLLQKLFLHIPVIPGAVIFFLLFLFTYHISDGYLGFNNLKIKLSNNLYSTNWLFPLGLPNNNFYSADYFPILPWTFLFFSGTFLGRWAKEEKFPQFMYQSRVPLFQWLGRHSLIIYIIHQPIIYGILWLISFWFHL